MNNKIIEIQDWGLIDYMAAWEKQKELVKDVQQKRNRNILVFCEHPSVITIGRNGSNNNILSSVEFLRQKNIQVIENNRGGDVTLHNPGQLVGYLIFNLSAFKEDLHWFLRKIEDSLIKVAEKYGITSSSVKGLTGVWVEEQRKIAAIGMHCSSWVTSHGFALNVNNDIREFDFIVPCGITNKSVTSISKEINSKIDFQELKVITGEVFKNNFNE